MILGASSESWVRTKTVPEYGALGMGVSRCKGVRTQSPAKWARVRGCHAVCLQEAVDLDQQHALTGAPFSSATTQCWTLLPEWVFLVFPGNGIQETSPQGRKLEHPGHEVLRRGRKPLSSSRGASMGGGTSRWKHAFPLMIMAQTPLPDCDMFRSVSPTGNPSRPTCRCAGTILRANASGFSA